MSAGRRRPSAWPTLEYLPVYSLDVTLPVLDKRCAGDVRVKCAVVVAVLLSATWIAAAQNSAKGTPPLRRLTLPPRRQSGPNPRTAAGAAVACRHSAAIRAAAGGLCVVSGINAAAAAAAAPSACQVGLGKIATFKPLPVLVGRGRMRRHRCRADGRRDPARSEQSRGDAAGDAALPDGGGDRALGPRGCRAAR